MRRHTNTMKIHNILEDKYDELPDDDKFQPSEDGYYELVFFQFSFGEIIYEVVLDDGNFDVECLGVTISEEEADIPIIKILNNAKFVNEIVAYIIEKRWIDDTFDFINDKWKTWGEQQIATIVALQRSINQYRLKSEICLFLLELARNVGGALILDTIYHEHRNNQNVVFESKYDELPDEDQFGGIIRRPVYLYTPIGVLRFTVKWDQNDSDNDCCESIEIAKDNNSTFKVATHLFDIIAMDDNMIDQFIQFLSNKENIDVHKHDRTSVNPNWYSNQLVIVKKNFETVKANVNTPHDKDLRRELIHQLAWLLEDLAMTIGAVEEFGAL